MLERLFIKNVALIEEASIEFDGKLNVLSGETGSGKSVILDSINFVLGSKADKSMIRYGAEEALVRAEFVVDIGSEADKALKEMDIDSDGTIIVSRRFSRDGKGAIKVNGNTVTTTMLKKVATHLVDVHGQSEHFFLLNENNQLCVIDGLCDQRLTDLQCELSKIISDKKALKDKIKLLGGSEQERMRRLDLLSFQISEIEGANLSVGELENLKSQKKLFDNAEKVISALGAVRGILSEDNGCVDMLSAARRQVSTITDVGVAYEDIYTRLDDLYADVSDLSETVNDLCDSFCFDEHEALAVEARLDLIKSLIKKYGVDEESVLNYLDKAKSEYDALNDATAELERISKTICGLDERAYLLCTEISEIRKNKCNEFCKDVEIQLKSLNIPNAKFLVEFNNYNRETAEITSKGADRICFLFSANRGEPPKPLNKVISGGEMSRFMLALKTQLKNINGISTYIFDEIDAGISGVTAKSVADKFIDISKDTQIIAVSHLPQVCASACAQFLISKHEDKLKTITSIEKLNREERIREIVRLTGAVVTDAAITHAEELLSQFGN